MKLSDLPPKHLKILDVGPSGTGKTARALTLGARAQLLDFGEEGHLTALTLKDKFHADRCAVDVQQFKETKLPKTAHAFNDFKDYVYKLTEQCADGTYPFDAIILDSVTELGRFSLNQIMSNSTRLGGPVEIQHYGLAFTQTTMVLDVLKCLPVLLYAIVHDQRDAIIKKSADGKKEIDRKDFVEVALTGKNMPAIVTRGFDEVWYSRSAPGGAGKQAFKIQTQNDELHAFPKTRLQVPNLFDTTNLSVWEILQQFGYKPPQKEIKPAPLAKSV